MANIATRYKDKSRKEISGFQLRAPKLDKTASIWYPAKSYTLKDVENAARIVEEIEKATAKGKKPNSDIYDDLNALNDSRLFSYLETVGIIELAKVTTLEELTEKALKAFEKLGDKPSTLENIKTSLQHAIEYFGADCLIQDIGKRNARQFGAYMETKGLKNSTLRKVFSHIKQVFKWGVVNLDDETARFNPFDVLTVGGAVQEKDKTPLTETEAAKILDALENTNTPQALTAFFMLGYRQGLRLLSEAPRLRWEMVDFERGVLQIRDVKRGKRGAVKVRSMPLLSETEQYLRRLKEYQKQNNVETFGFVFPEFWKIPGIEIKPNAAISYKYNAALKQAGIEHKTPFNLLRRTASNFWLEKVGRERENLYLGHTSNVAKRAYYDDNFIAQNDLDAARDFAPVFEPRQTSAALA